MKILVVSDNHGITRPFIQELKNHNDAEYIFHLGDLVNDAREIQKSTNIPVKMVRGNNDFLDKNIPWYEVVKIEEYNILLTHGHKEKINNGYSDLVNKAKECNADIAFYGHTHIYEDTIIDGVRIINPGSAGYDRGGEFESYIVMNIDKDNVDIKRVELK